MRTENSMMHRLHCCALVCYLARRKCGMKGPANVCKLYFDDKFLRLSYDRAFIGGLNKSVAFLACLLFHDAQFDQGEL